MHIDFLIATGFDFSPWARPRLDKLGRRTKQVEMGQDGWAYCNTHRDCGTSQSWHRDASTLMPTRIIEMLLVCAANPAVFGFCREFPLVESLA
jgi:hypothetical protein